MRSLVYATTIFFQIRREELETHLQCKTRKHLDLACRKLYDTQEEVTVKIAKLRKQCQEKVSNLQNQFEERLNIIQNQFEERVNVLQNQLAERIDTRQTEINEKVDTNHKRVEKELNTYRNLFFCVVVVFVAVVGVLLYHTTIVQNQQHCLEVLQ